MRIMRSILAALALLLFAGVTQMAFPTTAHAEARWQNFGADKAYGSRAAAIADAERTFVRAGWPAKAAKVMAEKMRTTPGERYLLTNGMRLDFMRSGSSGLWRNVLVDFKRPVQSMEFAAPAERWTETIDGVTYEAILPEVCNNLSGRKRGVPQEPCDWVLLQVGPQGGVASAAVLSPTYVDTLNCVVSYQGPGGGPNGRVFDAGNFTKLSETGMHPCDWREVVAYFAQPLTPIHGCFEVSPGWWVIQVDPSFRRDPNNILVLCLSLPDGRTTLSVEVRPKDFVKNSAGFYIATVWQSEPHVPATYRGHTWLWWEWDLSRGPELMRRSRGEIFE